MKPLRWILLPILLAAPALQASSRLPGGGPAAPEPSSKTQGSLLLELAGGQDPGQVGGRLGVQVLDRDGMFQFGLGILGHELHEDALMEVFLTGRKPLFPLRHQMLVPFVGLGGQVAFATEKVYAEDDWVDNDDDGSVDERGEEDTRLKDLLLGLTPEAGVLLFPRESGSLQLSARYTLTTDGVDSGHWVFGLGICLFGGK